jgi:hypothetical protein
VGLHRPTTDQEHKAGVPPTGYSDGGGDGVGTGGAAGVDGAVVLDRSSFWVRGANFSVAGVASKSESTSPLTTPPTTGAAHYDLTIKAATAEGGVCTHTHIHGAAGASAESVDFLSGKLRVEGSEIFKYYAHPSLTTTKIY